MHLESVMLLLDTNNMGNLNQNNEICDSIIFPRIDFNKYIYFVIENEI